MSRSPLTPNAISQAIKADVSVSPTSLQRPQTPQQNGTARMTNSRTLNPAHESFVIVQTEEDKGVSNPTSLPQPNKTTNLTTTPLAQNPDPPSVTHPKPYDAAFTFVGGVYPSLGTANEAAVTLAAKKSNCEIPSARTFPTSSEAFNRNLTMINPLSHHDASTSDTSNSDTSTSASTSTSDSTSPSGSPLLNPTARPQFIQQRSGDGRYSCHCTGSSGEGGEVKGITFEVRKIEVKPLGSRMGWNFSDDDA